MPPIDIPPGAGLGLLVGVLVLPVGAPEPLVVAPLPDGATWALALTTHASVRLSAVAAALMGCRGNRFSLFMLVSSGASGTSWKSQ